MRWLFKMALREARYNRFRGIVMLFSMVFGLTVLVSFSSIKQGFQENFYEIATILTGGDLRVEISGEPTERLKRLLPRLGDSRTAYWGTPVHTGQGDGEREAFLWLIQQAPEPMDEGELLLNGELPEFPEVDITLTEEQKQLLFANADPTTTLEAGSVSLHPNWVVSDDEVLPVWTKRIKRKPIERLAGNTAMIVPLINDSSFDWEQVWIYRFEGKYANERIARAKYILGYLLEEAHGVRLIYELPNETGFYHSFELISNTLFLAAFSALMLGTLAYTVTFVDFSKGKSTNVALLRSLGTSLIGSWGIYGLQVLLYAILAVIFSGLFSVGIQMLLPVLITKWTGVEMEIEIYWRTLLISLGFGGCFVVLPGFIVIMPLMSCEPVEVLRSVKMPAKRVENRWIQSILITVTSVLAVSFCLQMIDNHVFALGYLLVIGVVFFGLLLGVLGLRKLIRNMAQYKRSYPIAQAAANLFRTQNHYVFTLTSIAFGLFLITFLYLFFEGFAQKGVHEIAGYGSISDERVGMYLDWLQHVFFLNQWMGVTLLVIGVLAVFVLLTAQRRTRLYEAVVLGTLGANSLMIRQIMTYESIFAGFITAILGLVGGLTFGSIVFGLFFNIPVVMPWWLLVILFSGTVGVMVGMGFYNMKGIIGYPPLEVLRRRRHFSNW
jgi:putative ABC transport system permease protein